MRIILHVGMPKCGSSALQTFFSSRRFKEAVGGRFAYAAIDRTGQLSSGKRLVRKAAGSPYGYVSMPNIVHMGELEASQIKKLHAALRSLGRRREGVILSSEGWGPRAQKVTDSRLFDDERFRVRVLMYVRPQVEWFNSAWWQWGAWVEAPMQRWLRKNLSQANWYSASEAWSAQPWVDRVDVRLAGDDIVNDFLSLIGCDAIQGRGVNSSLPESVLRLFQRNRELRPGPHNSAIEFAIARRLQLGEGGAPWVIPRSMTEELVDFFREDNERLLDKLPPDHRDRMRCDDRWWNADCFDDRPVCSTEPDLPNAGELEALAVAALQAVHRLDSEVRQLRTSGLFGAGQLRSWVSRAATGSKE